ncbi:52 kDa repressor of the inhibitor of the protein kinase [Polypterus senegalus]|uniref:52 kDa repressor of the inhibitor of the protein kinase n=1 Tax=Polypterus senegalus TaxID=55291 RepID=UPI00196360CF|nr:52 kDa repressor of the inhibitor of the protein kinase [Polypterus senegalus]
MGGCSAPNCSNSTTIGKQLFRFPKDPVRMQKWVINCRRDFLPTPCSRLCEDHFEESQFEEIARSPAGGRKLKPNAIPTLFDVPDPPSPISVKEVIHALDSETDTALGDHSYARKRLRGPEDPEQNGEEQGEKEEACKRCDQYKAQLEQQQLYNAKRLREVDEMRKKVHKLHKIEKSLQSFLFEDQIRALTLSKHSRRVVWSQDTVKSARRIRAAVGVKGYEYLRELGYPLPSYRTLCNRAQVPIIAELGLQAEITMICPESEEKPSALSMLQSPSPAAFVET